MVSFFNELEIRKPCSKTVSLFNGLQMIKPFSKLLFLIMASKRKIIWKDTMSRDKTRSWLPINLELTDETHFGRNTC
jgi:hypothetical protein